MTVTRGTSNRDERGNTDDRRRRKIWLIETYRADVTIVRWGISDDHYYVVRSSDSVAEVIETFSGEGSQAVALPTCRCYRCGKPLTIETVTVDRIIPGCRGGTYRRNNIRPACGGCNSETGGALANHAKKKKGKTT